MWASRNERGEKGPIKKTMEPSFSPFKKVRKTAKGLALKRWFKEDWRTPSGKKGYEGGENTFRPTKRVSSKTPATWSELTPSQKARAKREKDTKGRVSKYKK